MIPLTIVYCGELAMGGTCLMRLAALKRQGHIVHPVDTRYSTAGPSGIVYRLIRRAGWSPDPPRANRQLLQSILSENPNIVWIDKGLSISPRTLRTIRRLGIPLLNYSPDDMSNPQNQTIQFRRSVQLYDLHVTTKSYNVAERKQMGARNVLFLNNGYCPATHRPLQVSHADRKRFGGGVGFIGAFEKERADLLLYLAQNDITVRIWGGGEPWRKWSATHRHRNLQIENAALINDDYVKAICTFDINLNFLRKTNRDLQTTRSVEIPAAGGFMLAERTQEHQNLFAEGIEAEYFNSADELLAKCRYYLQRPERRALIAKAGFLRTQNAGYSYDDIVDRAIRRLFEVTSMTGAVKECY